MRTKRFVKETTMTAMHGTTIVAVRKDGRICLGGDGQVTMGATVIKHKARKIRRLYQDRVLAGFAGATANAYTLFERFERKLEQCNANMTRSAVELAKDWRADKMLRHLEALLIVADSESLLIISGNGDVIEPDDDVTAIGSGGPYALAAARALVRHTGLAARDIVETALHLAAEICIYTNTQITIDELGTP